MQSQSPIKQELKMKTIPAVRFVRIKLNDNVEFDAVRVHTVKLN